MSIAYDKVVRNTLATFKIKLRFKNELGIFPSSLRHILFYVENMYELRTK